MKTSFFSYSVFTQTQNNQQMINSVINNSKTILNKLNELKAVAITMSVATAAQWVIAAVEFWMPFVGPVEFGFTTAAAIADTAATAIAWKTYNQAFNPVNNAIGELLTFSSYVLLHKDLNDLKESFSNLENNLRSLNTAMDAANAADTACLWVDPEYAAPIASIETVEFIIDFINSSLDASMSVLGYLDCDWSAPL